MAKAINLSPSSGRSNQFPTASSELFSCQMALRPILGGPYCHLATIARASRGGFTSSRLSRMHPSPSRFARTCKGWNRVKGAAGQTVNRTARLQSSRKWLFLSRASRGPVKFSGNAGTLLRFHKKQRLGLWPKNSITRGSSQKM